MTAAIHPGASRQLAAWFAQRPSFALMGEYSAGKSALLNALLGQSLLPTRVTATDLPAVWITHGAGLRLQGLTFAGALVDLASDDLTSARAMDFVCIRIECDAPFLSGIDIIDTPGISDPRMTTVIVEEMLKYIDFVVWCSPINQAWRQTERAFWNRVPQSVKAASVLALTRADIMRSAADVAKVVRRCVADTAGSFAAVLPVSAVEAQTATSLPDRDASGFPALLDILAQSIASATTRCGERGQRLLLTSPAEDPPPAPARKKPARVAKPSRSAPDGAAAEIVHRHTRTLHDLGPSQMSDTDIRQNLQQVGAELQASAALTADHLAVLKLALDVPADGPMKTARLKAQVRADLKDFAAGPWCTIGD